MADNLILAEIQEAVKTAMRERNKEASTTLRMAISEFKKEEIDKKIEITDFLIVAILHKMIKQRKDAASQFTDANRQELADKEIREIDILSVYLPEQMKESSKYCTRDSSIRGIINARYGQSYGCTEI